MRRQFGQRAAQLTGHLDGGQPVEANEFGVTVRECGRKCKGQQQDERDRRESAIRHRLAFPMLVGTLGTMPAGVEEPVFEGPVLGQIVPPVVFLGTNILDTSSDFLQT